MPRPTGSRNIRPGKAERHGYLRDLREAASEGDTDAKGWLLLYSELVGRPLSNIPQQARASHD